MPKALLSTIALLLLAAPGASELQVPAGWYAGDLHAHWPDSACYGVAPPEVMVQGMPADLNLVSVLLWNGGDMFEQNAQDYFRGRADDPVSLPHRIVHYDVELSAFGLADRLGHLSLLDLASIDFPRTGYQAPIQDWARAQGATVGSNHSQGWTSSYQEFPPITWCCTPYEAPVGMALGRVDYIEFQGIEPELRDQWRFFWYSLLNCGFRPGLAATSDSWCIHAVGSYRTYARLEGSFTYQNFVKAVARGRIVAVEENGAFIHFTIGTAEVGGEIAASRGQQLSLTARVLFPAGVLSAGNLEFIRNGEVVAAHPYFQIGGEMVVVEPDTAEQSSWYSVRSARSHAGAIFVPVDGRPIRPSVQAPAYYAAYMDYLDAAVRGGFFYQLQPAERESLLADIGRAQTIYTLIRDEAAAQSIAIGEDPLPPLPGPVTARPNPFSASLEITMAAGDAGNAAAPAAFVVRIFDAGGRLVRRLEQARSGPGPAQFIWDGASNAREPLPNGIYYYVVESGARVIGGGKAVRLR